MLDRSRDLSWLGDRQLLLLGGSTLDAALARFQPAGMLKAMSDSRELLAAGSGQAARWFSRIRSASSDSCVNSSGVHSPD